MTTFYINSTYARTEHMYRHIGRQLTKKGCKQTKDPRSAKIVLGSPWRGKIECTPLFTSNKALTFSVLDGKPYIPLTWHEMVRTEKGQKYFVKPVGGSLGLGIRIVWGDGKMLTQRDAVIQEAVPSLIVPFKGSEPRKFDMRYYASISIYPDGTHKIVTDDDAYMRFSSSKYVPGRPSAEITNVARQDPHGYKDCLCMLTQYTDRDLSHLIAKMKEYSHDALDTHYLKCVAGKSQYKGRTVTNIYGFDFIVTRNGLDVKILEINTTPICKGRLQLGPIDFISMLPPISELTS